MVDSNILAVVGNPDKVVGAEASVVAGNQDMVVVAVVAPAIAVVVVGTGKMCFY